MISNELLEEIIDISLKEEIIDEKFIKRIIEEVISKTDEMTRENFSGVLFGDINWDKNVVCIANAKSGKIKVDYERLISQYKGLKKMTMLDINLDIVFNLLHEVEHMKEPSRIKKIDFESTLLRLSGLIFFESLTLDKLKKIKKLLSFDAYNSLFSKVEKSLYLKIYDKIPSERLANIYAYQRVFLSIDSYYKFKELYPNTYNLFKEACLKQYRIGYESMLEGYDCCNIPIYDYLKFIDQLKILKHFDFYSDDINEFLSLSSKKFTLEEKMKYGLPITYEEYDLFKRLALR